MNEEINKLIALDKKARSMVEEADRYYNSTMNNLAKDIGELKDNYALRARNRIQNIREQEQALSAQTLDELKAKYDQMTKRLEQHYQEHQEELIQQIFDRCIGR